MTSHLVAVVNGPYPPAMDPDSLNTPKASLTYTLYVVFLRVVAIACLWFSLQYWAMLVGFSLHGQGRFDLLSLPWRAAASSLAVVFPVAALGLWLASSWGPVIWVIGAGAQILMYGFWSDVFGYNNLVMPMHGLIAVVYGLFRLAMWLEKRHRDETIRVDLP